MKKNKPRETSGNATKAGKRVESLYSANTVTVSNSVENGTPVVCDESVEYARDFINENKK